MHSNGEMRSRRKPVLDPEAENIKTLHEGQDADDVPWGWGRYRRGSMHNVRHRLEVLRGRHTRGERDCWEERALRVTL